MPSKGSHHDYGRLERFLKGISFRLKLFIALESLLRLASVFLIVLLGSLFLQGTGDLFPYLPFAYNLLALLALAWVLLHGLWKTASRLTLRGVARSLEKTFPRLKDDVSNALLLFQEITRPSPSDQTSVRLVAAHLQKTADEISEIPPNQVVSFRRALPFVRLLLPLVVAFTVVLALDPPFLNRSLAHILDPLSTLPPRQTFIALEPTPSTVLKGTPVVIKANATGHIPDRLSLRLWPEGGEAILHDMASEGEGRFTHRIASAQNSFRYEVFTGRFHTPVRGIRVVEAPDIGKVALTFYPPRYTGLPREVKEGGHIEALKGTVVNLEAQATKAVKEAKVILNHKDQILLKVDGDRLEGSLLVFYPGTYSLSVRDELGFENPEPVQHRILLIPDKYPEAEIIHPTEDLEVSAGDVLPLVYAARDDFGVTSIRLIYQLGASERSIPLKNLNESRSAGPELFRWDLAGLALTPGDRVSYRLEVWDNDSVSGPKAGYSRTYSLLLRDERDRAAREAERAQEIADALLDLLADQLEGIKDRKALSDEIARIMEKVDKQSERVGPEKTERFDLESLKRNLATLNRRIHELPDETVTQEVERLALLAEDLVKKTRMHEVEALAQEIKNRHNRLMDALRNQEGELTQEVLQDLLRELDKLKDLISQVMEAMGKMAAQLPDEFLNTPELGDLNFQDFFKDLEEIRNRLMAGDLAGALEAAQNLLQSLSEMMAAMARAGSQARMGGSDRLQSEMSRQANELEKILAEQKEILKGTDSVDQELKRSIDEETEKRLDRMMSQLREVTEQLRRLLPSDEGDSVSEAESLLKEKQIERLSELAQRLDKEFSERPEIRKLLKEWMKMLKDLTPDQSEVMTEAGRGALADLSSRQERLRERTKALGEALEMLAQLFPGMDTEIINDLKDGAGSMGRASGKLTEEDAPGAIPPEQEAIQSLTRSQQAMQQMAQQMAMRMQANRWGYPWSYDPRAGWYYGPWGPMPTLPQPEVKRPREQGYTGLDREEFDLPPKDAYKVPRNLREKVMEALKEEIPSQYRREVEQYFRGLTE